MIDDLLPWVVSNTLAALVLALLALSADLLWRRPAVVHGLWMLVLIKLLTPSMFAVPVGTWSTMLTTPVAAGKPTAANAPPEIRNRSIARGRPQPHSASEEFSALDPSDPSDPPMRRISRVALGDIWIPAVAAMWLGGSVICGLIALLRIRRFGRVLKDARRVGAGQEAECDRAARMLGLRRSPQAWMLPGPVTPMLWAPPGSARLLLPGELWEKLSCRQRHTLLLHELAHLKRRDHWARWVELLATIVFWWHPLVWWARSQVRQAEEYCCDAWVTWAQPGSADDYCSALVDVIEFISQGRANRGGQIGPVMPALATGVSRFQHLSRRLLMIDHATNHRGLGLTGTACIVAALAILPLAITRRGNAGVPAVPQAVPRGVDALADPCRKSADKGLEWLAANIPVHAAKPDAQDFSAKNRTAVVALCGMAFLASDSDLQQGPYHTQLATCVDAVLADCRDDGLIAGKESSALMYHHGYATLFLAEVYAKTHDARIKPRLDKAVELIAKSQNAQGSWRYVPRPMDGDMSITGCILNALLAASAAKIDVNPATITLATKYVAACRRNDGGYVYVAGSQGENSPPLTAEAAAVLYHAGGQADSVDAAVKFLKPFVGKKDGNPFESYLNYYAAQVLARNGDETSQAMYRALCELVRSRQGTDGSWTTEKTYAGKAYETACAVLALQARDGKLWIFAGGTPKPR